MNLQQFLDSERVQFSGSTFYTTTQVADWLKDHDTRLINKVLDEVKREVEHIIDQEVMWYNTNNQIPNTELVKGDEHWEMIQKVVKDSITEVGERNKKDISTVIDQLKLK